MKSNVHTANAYKRLLKPTKKSRLLMDALSSIVFSRLAQFVGVLVGCVSVGIARGWWWFLCIPVAILSVFWRQLIFECFVVAHLIETQLGIFQWYTVVDDNLILGAIPLQDQQHVEEFKKLNIRAVVSVVQPWELETRTLFGPPVGPEQWHREGIKHYILSCKDFVPPPFEVLDEGAKILDHHLSNKQRVYVHCKSGIGRSASVVLSYFLRFKNEDLLTLHNQLKSKRSVVFEVKSKQMQNLIQYNAKREDSR